MNFQYFHIIFENHNFRLQKTEAHCNFHRLAWPTPHLSCKCEPFDFEIETHFEFFSKISIIKENPTQTRDLKVPPMTLIPKEIESWGVRSSIQPLISTITRIRFVRHQGPKVEEKIENIKVFLRFLSFSLEISGAIETYEGLYNRNFSFSMKKSRIY